MTPKPQTRIQTRNREAILEAALDVFSQQGFRGATLDMIAQAAGLSKPNLLYYFPSKDAIHATLLENLLATWLDPLKALRAEGDPVEEILGYIRRKLQMSRDMPRESRLFANEILQGAPRIQEFLTTHLRAMVDEKAAVIARWQQSGRLPALDPHHLIYSIWALTQHYADFDVQIRALSDPDADPFVSAEVFLETLYRRLLT